VLCIDAEAWVSTHNSVLIMHCLLFPSILLHAPLIGKFAKHLGFH
jgi:hypothetical protein